MLKPDIHSPNDEDVALAQTGDRAAFGRVMDTFLPMSYRLAYRLLGSSEEAQDVCQDAFLRVWEHFPTYDRTRAFTAWLSTIVTRLAYDRLRSRQRYFSRFLGGDSGQHYVKSAAAVEPGIVRSSEWAELNTLIISLAGRLPPTQRIVFALRDLEDLDVMEVAHVTGLSRSSVKANLSYARRRIREILVREFHVEDAHT